MRIRKRAQLASISMHGAPFDVGRTGRAQRWQRCPRVRIERRVGVALPSQLVVLPARSASNRSIERIFIQDCVFNPLLSYERTTGFPHQYMIRVVQAERRDQAAGSAGSPSVRQCQRQFGDCGRCPILTVQKRQANGARLHQGEGVLILGDARAQRVARVAMARAVVPSRPLRRSGCAAKHCADKRARMAREHHAAAENRVVQVRRDDEERGTAAGCGRRGKHEATAEQGKCLRLRYHRSSGNDGQRSMTLDKTDRAILMAIQADGRMTNASLAEAVGLSETPCARRLKRLEAEGYIEGYRAELSKRALQIGVTAFALVRFGVHDRRLADEFERQIQGLPRIVACHNVAGSADYLVHVVARDLEDYGAFLRDVLRALPGVTSVESVLSLREVKRNAGLPLL